MAKVGWGRNSGAKGAFYTRYSDRVNWKGVEFVDKHKNIVYRSVVQVPDDSEKGFHYEGRGYIRTEPRYANLSGGDKNITYTPALKPLKLRKIVLRGTLGPRASRTVLDIRKPKPAISAL